MLCKTLLKRKKKIGTVPVYLNVYDLTPINGYAYWFGLGIYHSGVQVHGVEYGFEAHDHPSTGIFEVQPRQCPGFIFRKSILIGRTDLGPQEVHAFMEQLAQEYSGNTYHLITKNCNHFCDAVCIKLTGKAIPRWVNRLARLGLFCNCFLPAELNEMKVCRVGSEDRARSSGEKKLRSHLSRFVTSNSITPPTSILPSSTGSEINSKQNPYTPAPASLVHNTKTSNLILKL